MDSAPKRIIVGVTGSIAAYKAADIIRELQKRHLEITVVMTADSQRFISPMTLAALSRNAVATNLFSPSPYGPVPHIHLAQHNDLLLVAPATAHCIAAFAHGLADDLLSALFLAQRSPVLIAPAMNPSMYAHPMVQANIAALKGQGVFFVDPVDAEVVCGQRGQGHLAPLEDICDKVQEILNPQQPFKGRRFLITAGPTREPIDPVRFISNRSSGKMGYALAEAACMRGARVTLISGPTSLPPPAGVSVVKVTTADEMLSAVNEAFSDAEITIMAAGVADFKPVTQKDTKIKKRERFTEIRLEPTTDILAAMGKRKGSGQILVGFAAEDRDLIPNAREKMVQKNLDLIIANDISRPDAGFDSDTNQVTLVHRSGTVHPLPKGDKRWVAERIMDYIEGMA
ncbi:MAG: bifunctional phosphopantothenoylcysteine decarboxylase/phosphopantothenate--cysteine ligase CoaBC [bacterium]